MALALLSHALLGGMVFGAGVAGFNNAQNSCEASKSAVETLKNAKIIRDKWDNALVNLQVLDMETVSEITKYYILIENYQKQIVQAQNEAKKTKIIVVALGFTIIFILYFTLLYKYFKGKIRIKRLTK